MRSLLTCHAAFETLPDIDDIHEIIASPVLIVLYRPFEILALKCFQQLLQFISREIVVIAMSQIPDIMTIESHTMTDRRDQFIIAEQSGSRGSPDPDGNCALAARSRTFCMQYM